MHNSIMVTAFLISLCPYIVVDAILHVVVVEIVSLDQCQPPSSNWAVLHCQVRILQLLTLQN